MIRDRAATPTPHPTNSVPGEDFVSSHLAVFKKSLRFPFGGRSL